MLRVEHIKNTTSIAHSNLIVIAGAVSRTLLALFFAYLSSLFDFLLHLLCCSWERRRVIVRGKLRVRDGNTERESLSQCVSNGRVFCAKIFYFLHSFLHDLSELLRPIWGFELSNRVERKSEAFADVTWRINNVAAMTTWTNSRSSVQ